VVGCGARAQTLGHALSLRSCGPQAILRRQLQEETDRWRSKVEELEEQLRAASSKAAHPAEAAAGASVATATPLPDGGPAALATELPKGARLQDDPLAALPEAAPGRANGAPAAGTPSPALGGPQAAMVERLATALRLKSAEVEALRQELAQTKKARGTFRLAAPTLWCGSNY